MSSYECRNCGEGINVVPVKTSTARPEVYQVPEGAGGAVGAWVHDRTGSNVCAGTRNVGYNQALQANTFTLAVADPVVLENLPH